MSSYLSLAPYYDALFPTPTGLIDWILKSGHQQILDLGCGTGLLVEALTQNLCDAQGFDPDPQMIQTGLERNPKLSLHCKETHGLKDQSFDLICTVGNVCSYWDREQWDLQIAEITRLLKPGGQWLLQTVCWDALLLQLHWNFLPRLIDDFTLERHYQIRRDQAQFQLRLSHKGKCLAEETHTLYPRKAQEIAELCSVHLQLQGQWSNWNFAPFEPSSQGATIQLWQKI